MLADEMDSGWMNGQWMDRDAKNSGHGIREVFMKAEHLSWILKHLPPSSNLPSTILGRKLVLNKFFLDEFTTELAFLSEGNWLHFPQPFVSPYVNRGHS